MAIENTVMVGIITKKNFGIEFVKILSVFINFQ